MNGWLIYEKESYERNKIFAQMLINEAKENKIDISLKFKEEIDFSNLPQFAINRTYDYPLSKTLENLGVRVFNNSTVSEICNDKYKTYEFFKSKDIPMMETKLADRKTEMNFPVVLKPVDGHGGKDVCLINSKEEYRDYLNKHKDEKIIVQKLASDKGKDLRVYVIGNEIIAGMLRKSDTDFRSNFSLGGNAELHKLNDEEKEIIKKVTLYLDFDFAGIDLIYHNEKPVLNEIEDVVGSRMLYKYTDIDILKRYVEYIKGAI